MQSEWLCMLVYRCRYTSGIVPRSVYTSGKSSSAAGLTATVAKEPETGEFCIEVKILTLLYFIGSVKFSCTINCGSRFISKFL